MSRICKICQKEFEPHVHNQLCCSPQCSCESLRQYARERQRRLKTYEQKPLDISPIPKVVSGVCVYCGKKFQLNFDGELFCSDHCRRNSPLGKFIAKFCIRLQERRLELVH